MHSATRCFPIALALLLASWASGAEQSPADTPPRYVRIGHYQCVIHDGDFEANLKTMLHALELATDARLDIVSFPECFLTGFFSEEKAARASAFPIDGPEMNRVLEKTAGFDMMILVGFSELRGEKFHKTVAVIERGKLVGCYRKAMPTTPFTTPGREFPVFEKKGLKFGIVICADGGYIEPSRILALKGAKLIFAPHYNFTPGAVQHSFLVRHDHIARAVENGVYFLRANNFVPETLAAGPEAHKTGCGDSYLLDPMGQVVAGAGLFHEHLMIYNLDLQQTYRSPWNLRSARSGNALLEQYEEALKAERDVNNNTQRLARP